jgi:ferredoxin
MAIDPYEELAAVLDTIPYGFAHIEDGTHLRVLQWIFTPDEASLASKLTLSGETAEEISERLKIPAEQTRETLDTMVEKNQIRRWTTRSGDLKYALMPLIVGISEEQNERMDEEFAKLMEEYFAKGKGEGLFDSEPPVFQVIPVNTVVKAELDIHPYKQAEQLIRTAKSWGVRECICKKQQGLIGNDCSYPTTVCMVLTPWKENAYDDSEIDTPVTMEESLKLLKDAEEAGLVHCTMNVQSGQYYICNCCTCCCAILRGLSTYDQPHAFVNSGYVARVDDELCTGCGTCIDRCQFDALTIPEDISVVELNRCIGCGVCAVTCPENAIQLVNRDDGQEIVTPETLQDWMAQKAASRGVDPSKLIK